MKKENVYVEVRTEKQAKKLKKVLSMFGESELSFGTGCAFINGNALKYFNCLNGWGGTCDLSELYKISIKQLRNILALEHLKEGDVVVVKGNDTGIKRVGVVNSFESFSADEIVIYSDNFTDLDQKEPKDDSLGFAGNFIRYATDKEKELLKPTELTAEEKVIEYAKSVDWDFIKVYKFINNSYDVPGLSYNDYDLLEGDSVFNKTENIFNKHKPKQKC